MNNHLRCPNCNFINFATAASCKRCRNPLQNVNYSSEGTTLNININLPPGVFQQSTEPIPPQTIGQLPPQLNQTDKQYLEDQQRPTASFQPPDYQSQNYPVSFQTPNYQSPTPSGYYQPTQMNPPPSYQNSFPQPYAQPQMQGMFPQGIWRRGSELVIHRNAKLPPSCVKCGSSYTSDISYVGQRFRWHNPLLYIALLSPLIYCILSLILSQTVSLQIPLCQKHVEERSSIGKFLAGGSIFSGIIVFLSFRAGNVGFGILLFLAAFIGLVLAHEYLYKPLQVSKIESDYVHLKRVDEGYLNQFPYC